jgi:hypothetical protein
MKPLIATAGLLLIALAAVPNAAAWNVVYPNSCVGTGCPGNDLACAQSTCINIAINCAPPVGNIVCDATFGAVNTICNDHPTICDFAFSGGVCTGYQYCGYGNVACVNLGAAHPCPTEFVSACAGAYCPAGEAVCVRLDGSVSRERCEAVCDVPQLCTTVGEVTHIVGAIYDDVCEAANPLCFTLTMEGGQGACVGRYCGGGEVACAAASYRADVCIGPFY